MSIAMFFSKWNRPVVLLRYVPFGNCHLISRSSKGASVIAQVIAANVGIDDTFLPTETMGGFGEMDTQSVYEIYKVKIRNKNDKSLLH